MGAQDDAIPAAGPTVLLVDLDDTLFDHLGTSGRALARFARSEPALSGWTVRRLLDRYTEHLNAIHPKVLTGTLSIDEARIERMRRLFEEAGGRIDRAGAAERARRLRTIYQSERRAVPGASPFLRYVHRRARVVIVSNNLLEEQREKLSFLGLSPFVDDLVTSEEVRAIKPDPKLFNAALARSGSRREEAVVLGDSFGSDVVGARRAGLPVVWFNPRAGRVPPGAPKVPQLRSLRPPSAAWAAVVAAWRHAGRRGLRRRQPA